MTTLARLEQWVKWARCSVSQRVLKKKRRKIHDPSHISSSPSEPPVYIWFLYKLINVINRPGRIVWESVFCTETVSILNEREGGWRGGREKEISTFFPPVLFFSSSSSAHSVLCCAKCVEISRNQTQQQRYRFCFLYQNPYGLIEIEPRSSRTQLIKHNNSKELFMKKDSNVLHKNVGKRKSAFLSCCLVKV